MVEIFVGYKHFHLFPQRFFLKSVKSHHGAVKSSPFPKQALVFSTNLLKAMWEKDKFLVTNNFTFPHTVVCLLWQTFHQVQIIVGKVVEFGRV